MTTAMAVSPSLSLPCLSLPLSSQKVKFSSLKRFSGSLNFGGLSKGRVVHVAFWNSRDFCVKSAVSGADVAVADDSVTSSSRTLLQQGGDSLGICRVVNGMWQTSGGWGTIDPKMAVEAMFRYADQGFTTFDMADHYGPAEMLYGVFYDQARRERGEEYASNLQGCTKWCPPPVKMTRGVTLDAIERSRKRMNSSSLDMVQFHWWDYSDSGYLDALKHMTDLKEEGKIKTLGLTNFDTKHLEIILDNGIPIVSNQVQHSLVDMRPQQNMKTLCESKGVQLITYGTICGGLLSEKFLDSREPNSWGGPSLSTPSQKKYKRMIDAWGGWGLFQELLRECQVAARKHSIDIPAVGLAYVLNQPSVGGSMVGVRLGLSEHISSTKKVFDINLDEEDKDRLESVMKRGRDLMQVIGDCGDEYR